MGTGGARDDDDLGTGDDDRLDSGLDDRLDLGNGFVLGLDDDLDDDLDGGLDDGLGDGLGDGDDGYDLGLGLISDTVAQGPGAFVLRSLRTKGRFGFAFLALEYRDPTRVAAIDSTPTTGRLLEVIPASGAII